MKPKHSDIAQQGNSHEEMDRDMDGWKLVGNWLHGPNGERLRVIAGGLGGDGTGVDPTASQAASGQGLWDWSGMFRQGQPEASPEVEAQDLWDSMMQRARERLLTDPQYRDTWQSREWVARQYSEPVRRLPWIEQARPYRLPGGGIAAVQDLATALER